MSSSSAFGASKMLLGEFICGRLTDVGCFHVFNIPGDYGLNILNTMAAHPRMTLVNCLNELNVSYAAEAYARVNGFGAMCVVTGVGELCTLNGLALANAEKVPMMLIVPTVPRVHIRNKLRFRHQADPEDQYRSAKITDATVEASVYLESTECAIDLIDNLIITSINRKRPVCLQIPADLQREAIWVPRGREHLRFGPRAPTRGLPIRAPLDETQFAEIDYFARAALAAIKTATSPVLVVGNQVVCYNLATQVCRLAETLTRANGTVCKLMHVPRLTGVIGREHGCFAPTKPLTPEAFDCVVQVGFDLCDMYKGITLDRLPEVQLSVLAVRIGDATVNSVYFPDVIRAMQQILDAELKAAADKQPAVSDDKENAGNAHTTAVAVPAVVPTSYAFTEAEMAAPLTPKALGVWTSDNAREGDVWVTCTGLTIWDMLQFPSKIDRPQFGQEFYATIGWGLPATIGVMFAYMSMGEKPTLSCWIGDGAFMMTAQDLAALHRYSLHHGFVVRVFLFDNQGYLIERIIHENIYNDLPPLDFEPLAKFSQCHYKRVETLNDLSAAYSPAADKVGTTLVHCVLGKFDCVDAKAAVGLGTVLCKQNNIPLDRPTLPGF